MKIKSTFIYKVPAIVWALFIFTSCLISPKYIPEVKFDLFQLDKLVHLVLFGMQFFLIVWSFRKLHRLSFAVILYAALFSFLYGVLIEFLQMIMKYGRSADLDDMIANTGGVLLVSLFYTIYYRSLIFRK